MKVLIVVCTGFVSWGGLTTVIMNYYRELEKDGLIIDFASNNCVSVDLLKEIQDCGSKYIKLPKRKKVFKYMFELYKVLEQYDVIHIHGNSSTMLLELFPAVLRKIPKRIVHCHNTKSKYVYLNKFLKPMFNHMYTHALAVSKQAGEWLYGKGEFQILNNAIPINKYSYEKKTRDDMREKLGVIDEQTIVYGHVGKINVQKNHLFLVELFYEIQKYNSNSKLLLVGDGPLRQDTEKAVKDLGLENDVLFVGMQKRVEYWLQAMDCFILPSRWEGFCLALVEAQANGLKCFTSAAAAEEAIVLNTTERFPMELGVEVCAKQICNALYTRIDKQTIRQQFSEKGLNISEESNKLRRLYIDGVI